MLFGYFFYRGGAYAFSPAPGPVRLAYYADYLVA
jgi:hypothetical protein